MRERDQGAEFLAQQRIEVTLSGPETNRRVVVIILYRMPAKFFVHVEKKMKQNTCTRVPVQS